MIPWSTGLFLRGKIRLLHFLFEGQNCELYSCQLQKPFCENFAISSTVFHLIHIPLLNSSHSPNILGWHTFWSSPTAILQGRQCWIQSKMLGAYFSAYHHYTEILSGATTNTFKCNVVFALKTLKPTRTNFEITFEAYSAFTRTKGLLITRLIKPF